MKLFFELALPILAVETLLAWCWSLPGIWEPQVLLQGQLSLVAAFFVAAYRQKHPSDLLILRLPPPPASARAVDAGLGKAA